MEGVVVPGKIVAFGFKILGEGIDTIKRNRQIFFGIVRVEGERVAKRLPRLIFGVTENVVNLVLGELSHGFRLQIFY